MHLVVHVSSTGRRRAEVTRVSGGVLGEITRGENFVNAGGVRVSCCKCAGKWDVQEVRSTHYFFFRISSYSLPLSSPFSTLYFFFRISSYSLSLRPLFLHTMSISTSFLTSYVYLYTMSSSIHRVVHIQFLSLVSSSSTLSFTNPNIIF